MIAGEEFEVDEEGLAVLPRGGGGGGYSDYDLGEEEEGEEEELEDEGVGGALGGGGGGLLGDLALPADLSSLDPEVLSTLPQSVQLEVFERIRDAQMAGERGLGCCGAVCCCLF